MSRVKSSEQGSSLFLIQPSVDAPPPPAISMNTGCFSLLYIVFGNIRGYSPYIQTSRSRLNPACMATHEPVQRPWIAFIKKAPSILRQLKGGNQRSEPTAGRQVLSREPRSGTMFSIQPCLSAPKPASVSVQRPGSVASAGLHLWWWLVVGQTRNSSSLETEQRCQRLSLLSCCVLCAHTCRSSINSACGECVGFFLFFF